VLLPLPPIVLEVLLLLPAVLPVGLLVVLLPDPPAPSKLLPGLEQLSDARLAMTAESETVRAVRARRRERGESICKSLIGGVASTPMSGAKFRLLNVEFLFYFLLLIEYMFS
jgi:hypothetical protein